MPTVKKGSTDQTFYFKLVDPTTGDEETAPTISDLTMFYVRERHGDVNNAATALADASAAHGDWKMFMVDATQAPGLARADYPDAAFTASDAVVRKVILGVRGTAIDTAMLHVDLEDATLTEIYSDTTIIGSDLIALSGEVSDIYSDTTIITSDVVVIDQDCSDIKTKLDSDSLLYLSDLSDILSDGAQIVSDMALLSAKVDSDSLLYMSDLSDIYSESIVLASAIAGIGTAGGAALNIDATTDNYGGGIPGVTVGTTKVGTQTNTYSSTSVLDGTCHVMTHAAQVVDIVYQFLCGGGTTVVAAVWTGCLNPINDSATIYAWNHTGGGAWESVGTIAGQTSTTAFVVKNIPLFPRHIGTSSTELGKVYIRIASAAAYNHIVRTDQLYVTYAVTSRSVGYEDGAIWIDTVSGTAGTEAYVNGTADNPVLTLADAYTLATAVGVNSFRLLPASSITLTATAANSRIQGQATIALNGQSIADARFIDAYTISGTGTGDDWRFVNCGVGTCTLAHGYMDNCSLKGTITLTAANEYHLHDCADAVSAGTATFVFAAGAELYLRNWRGGVQLNGMVAGDQAFIDGAGRIIIDATCTGGTITVRGHFTLTGEAAFIAAGGTITDSARFAEDQTFTPIETKLNSDSLLYLSDLSDIYSELVKVYSDTTHVDSDVTALSAEISDIGSDLIALSGEVSDVYSDTTALGTALANLSTKVDSDSLLYLSDLSDILSDTAHIDSDVTALSGELSDVYSDTAALTTAVAALSTKVDSDSLLYLSDLSDIYSDTTRIHSDLLALSAEVSDIGSDLALLSDEVSDIYSDTTRILSDTTAGWTTTVNIYDGD